MTTAPDSQNPQSDSPKEPERASALETLGTFVDAGRDLLTKTWKLGTLMLKGAYLVQERRRLLRRLGELAYARTLEPSEPSPFLDEEMRAVAHQLERMNKKIELEEKLILGIRFGTRPSRPSRKGFDKKGSQP